MSEAYLGGLLRHRGGAARLYAYSSPVRPTVTDRRIIFVRLWRAFTPWPGSGIAGTEEVWQS